MDTTHGYPSEWVYAATYGYMAGRFGDKRPSDYKYYNECLIFGMERYLFKFQFDKGRYVQACRIARGAEQPPGSVYDPKLDDKKGAFTDRDYKAYFRKEKNAEH